MGANFFSYSLRKTLQIGKGGKARGNPVVLDGNWKCLYELVRYAYIYI